MKNIFAYSNSITFSTNRDSKIVIEETLDALDEKFNRMKPIKRRRTGDTLYFSGGMFRFVGNWNFLKTITEIDIRLEGNDRQIVLGYEIKFAELFVISLLLGLHIFYTFDVSVVQKMLIFFLQIALFYGINAGIAILRCNRLMRSAIADILRNEPPAISNEQQEWISDACGHAIAKSDEICPDYGIRLI